MTIMDGIKLRNIRFEELKKKVKVLDRRLCLAVVQVGEDLAGNIYVEQKKKMAKELGYIFNHIKIDGNCVENDLLNLIDKLNDDSLVDGILVQMPLPKHINSHTVQNRIVYYKDVDGLNDINKKVLTSDLEVLKPCTPLAIMSLLKHYDIEIKGKRVVVVGRSELVGKPTAKLLVKSGAKVDICHSKTENLSSYTSKADILVVAVGKANLITSDMVNNKAVVIDVGINRIEGKICGDVDFVNVAEKCSYITPVPGGVGPMTIAELAENVYRAYCLAKKGEK